MKIGIIGPASLDLIRKHFDGCHQEIPKGYECPLISQIVNELIRQGHFVSLYTLDCSLKKPLVLRGEKMNLFVGRMRRRSFRRMLDCYKGERDDLSSFLKQDDSDIIHAQWLYEFALVAIKSQKPYLITAHDVPSEILKFEPHIYRLYRFLISKYVIKKTQYLSAVSPYVLNKLTYAAGFKGSIKVIPNGLSIEKKDLKEDCRLEYPNRVNLFCIADNSRRKNVKKVIEAFGLIRQTVSDAQLNLIGGGLEKKSEIFRWAEKNHLNHNINFLGFLPHNQVIELLKNNCDILITGSLEESFGMTLLEAMLLGIPVVGGEKSGGVPWVLGYGEYGYLADVKNPRSIAEKVINILNNREVSKEKVLKAQNKVLTDFPIEHVVKQYLAYYGEITRAYNAKN